jgi:proline dehydrogenase
MSVLDRAVVRLLPAVPRAVVRRLSSPYIAGATLADARRTVAVLNRQGKLATVDVLGEEICEADEASAIARAYGDVLAAIEADGLDANVSVKLTGFGLKLDLDLCRRLLEEIVRDAARRGNFVRIDMEDSSCTDDTLDLYRGLRAGGHENVGIVLQARLKRTLADVDALRALRPNVRLCKGIYLESPEIAFQDDDVIRRSFVSGLDALLGAGCYVGVATHDEWLLEQTLARVQPLAPDVYELQMLLGVRERRAAELVAAGHRLRIYVPYGRQWYEYSLRRLQENPRVAGYVARDVAGRLVPGRSPR